MADNDSNIQNSLGDHIATSGELQENQVLDLANDFNTGLQQADSVIDLTSSGSPGHPVVQSSSPRATPAPLSSPGRAVDVEQGNHPDDRSEQPRAPVAEMLPSNPPDSPLFCSQESEATPEPVTNELSGHHAAVSEAGPVYSNVLTQTNAEAQPLNASVAGQETTDAMDGRYHCPLCHKSYSRLSRVREHFEICQYTNGNPDDKVWNADPSCWPQRTPVNPDNLVCPLCQCKFSRASEAAAHFVTCADKNGNPQNIVFQGINTGIDTLYGQEEGEVGQYRCALCDKVSGKRSHARTHWKGCPVRQKTPARKLRRYDNMGRVKDRTERADHGKKVAGKPSDRGSTQYRCGLCNRKNQHRHLAVDHFKRCLDNNNTTRDKISHLDDTGMPIRPASEASVRVSEPGRKRSRRVAFDDDTSGDEETADDAAPAAKKSTTKQQVAEESGGAGAASDITGKSKTSMFILLESCWRVFAFPPKRPQCTSMSLLSHCRRGSWRQRGNSVTLAQSSGLACCGAGLHKAGNALRIGLHPQATQVWHPDTPIDSGGEPHQGLRKAQLRLLLA